MYTDNVKPSNNIYFFNLVIQFIYSFLIYVIQITNNHSSI